MQRRLKALLLYPNSPLLNPPPVSVGIFSALLKAEGIEVMVFDTTFYNAGAVTSDKTKEENMQVRPFSFKGYNLPFKNSSYKEDLRALVEDYEPDLIGLSVLETTWTAGAELLDAVMGTEVPVVAGGVFATFAPEIVLAHPAVSMICIGEGERAIVELCRRLRDGKDYRDIKNLWIKQKGAKAIKNDISAVVDIDRLPIPDYSVFDNARFLRPMAGRVYRTVPVETNRGCPYSCAFCNSPTTARLYQKAGAGAFFRKKCMDRIQEELRFLIDKWDAEYVYFLSDNFLAMSDAEFDRFAQIYGEFKLPFWIQSRVETITPYRVKKLKEAGCHRMSIGLEHGNEEFRRKILKKTFTNDKMIEAAKMLADAGIPLSVNNIIGFPNETRGLIFDTIELNRRIPFDTANAYAFVPFHGTPLYKYCLQKGYITEKDTTGCLTIDTPLDMPQLSRADIRGLRKTFAFYARLPKEFWPDISKAEADDAEGKAVFQKLQKIYREKYF